MYVRVSERTRERSKKRALEEADSADGIRVI